ncbi:MAG: glycosyltransferase family 9 protein [Bacteroidia bacterium]|nr:glycosyltransferase family 9 protein [Bacteroidia bacterium]NNC85908.1 glycosyltransferase family 9 protein [Bacteroidia bacterium]NNM16411.1 glycosyltransferase family 9 protein [Bacteroidia bacterium]
MKVLIIQTAFIGDVILATSLIEKLAETNKDFTIDFLLRKGNEFLLDNNPHVHEILIWYKKKPKSQELPRIIKEVKKRKYDLVINLQRFLSTGIITKFSGAKETRGFEKNPMSFMFSKKYKHELVEGMHEVDRNISLLEGITDSSRVLPKLYPGPTDYEKVANYQTTDYVCIAPSSVWFTKQVPESKWIELVNQLSTDKIYLVGSNYDRTLCDKLREHCEKKIVNLAGKLSLLQTAALFKNSKMNYVNDSAPLHIASAMRAPVTAFFCSTIPKFGFGPLSENAKIAQVDYDLECRPCGLHGLKECPKKHFKCANEIDMTKYAM